MPPRLLSVAGLVVFLSSCGLASSEPVAKNDGFDPRHLDEYHLRRLDGTQNCAKVRICDEAVTANTDVARLGVNPDYESWPEGAIP